MRASRIISTVYLNPFLVGSPEYRTNRYYRVSCGDKQARWPLKSSDLLGLLMSVKESYAPCAVAPFASLRLVPRFCLSEHARLPRFKTNPAAQSPSRQSRERIPSLHSPPGSQTGLPGICA